MKNKFKFGALIMLGALTIVACKKDEPLTPAAEKTATFKGKFFLNSDLTNDTTETGASQIQYETPPTGTAVTFTIDAEDLLLDPDNSYNYGTRTVTVETNANGEFTAVLPALTNSSWDYVVNDFTLDVRTGYSNNQPVFDEDVLFSYGSSSVTVSAEQIKIEELYY